MAKPENYMERGMGSKQAWRNRFSKIEWEDVLN